MLFLALPLRASATQEDFQREADERREQPAQSNEIERWPEGPAVGAESAILMDADTGLLLYYKNMDEELFPASTTKLMTCLVAIENCPLSELITVNQSAIDANEADGSHMYLKAGETLSLEELLYGILINSANEACNAVGEHIAGSMGAYVDMMNARAAELGCTHTHFVTTNGLHSEDHYTSAHDLALIAQAFFSHDVLASMARTLHYDIPETELHGEHSLKSKNKLYEGQEYEYDGLVGSKTGFTSKSRQTLVSCAERNGLRLICVVMREETPEQYTDTLSLLDYGFQHFAMRSSSELEQRFLIRDPDLFGSTTDVFGNTSRLCCPEAGAMLLLPDSLNLNDLQTEVRYDVPNGQLARIDYSWDGIILGSTSVVPNHVNPQVPRYISVLPGENEGGKRYINIYHVLGWCLGLGLGFVILHLALHFFKLYLAHARHVAGIRRHRSEVVKSRSDLRRNYRRHMPEKKAPMKKAPPKYVSRPKSSAAQAAAKQQSRRPRRKIKLMD